MRSWMRRAVAAAVAVLAAVSLCACGGQSGQGTAQGSGSGQAAEIATLADAFAQECSGSSWGYSDRAFVYVYETEDGGAWRVVALMDEKMHDELDAVDIFDEDHDQKIREIAGAMKVESVEDLMAGVTPQAELDKLVGRKGQELLDEGYELAGWYVFDDEAAFFLNKGYYQYRVHVEEKLEGGDDYDGDGEFPGLTVKDVQYNMLNETATDYE